jgi:hypothetical protein
MILMTSFNLNKFQSAGCHRTATDNLNARHNILLEALREGQRLKIFQESRHLHLFRELQVAIQFTLIPKAVWSKPARP